MKFKKQPLRRQAGKKGDCNRCGVNLRPRYGYVVEDVLLCEHCTKERIGKDRLDAFKTQENNT